MPMTYIGYPTLEAWARVADRKLPVYAGLVEEPQPPDSHGIQTVLLVIWVSQHRPSAQEVHYFRCRVGLLEYIGKTPFGNDHPERKQRAGQAWGLIRSWLEEQGFSVREGVIAQKEARAQQVPEECFLEMQCSQCDRKLDNPAPWCGCRCHEWV